MRDAARRQVLPEMSCAGAARRPHFAAPLI
ncbi:hypothetical protein RHECNPAF_28005 [Rhizobium etli CNPAF512]|nr:hypothetical protein RHECNPAF_28005 [Rhizobium etli CNPAF512]